jgi:excisionase family DNA binding protein
MRGVNREVKNMSRRCMSTKEVAEALGCSTSVTGHLLRTGQLKGFKIHSHWRVRPDELEKFVERRCEK